MYDLMYEVIITMLVLAAACLSLIVLMGFLALILSLLLWIVK